PAAPDFEQTVVNTVQRGVESVGTVGVRHRVLLVHVRAGEEHERCAPPKVSDRGERAPLTKVRSARAAYRGGAAHLKFFSSSVLPEPEYAASCGYGQSGLVRAGAVGGLLATMRSGARPLSTHWSIVEMTSITNGPSPPLQ